MRDRSGLFAPRYPAKLADLKTVVEACLSRGMRPVLLDMPLNVVAVGHAFDDARAMYREGCMALAEEQGIPYLRFGSSIGLHERLLRPVASSALGAREVAVQTLPAARQQADPLERSPDRPSGAAQCAARSRSALSTMPRTCLSTSSGSGSGWCVSRSPRAFSIARWYMSVDPLPPSPRARGGR